MKSGRTSPRLADLEKVSIKNIGGDSVMRRFISLWLGGIFVALSAGCGRSESESILADNRRFLAEWAELSDASLKVSSDAAKTKEIMAKLEPIQKSVLELKTRVDALPPDQRDAVRQEMAKQMEQFKEERDKKFKSFLEEFKGRR